MAATGGRARYPTLDGLDLDTLTEAKHIVLLVIDGMGYEFLTSSREGRVLRRHLKGSMTSVFPPTTATAITTYLTGLAPRQHGVTGWFTYFSELGAVVTVLPFVTRLGAVPLRDLGVDPTTLLGHVPVFDGMQRACFSVSPSQIAHSDFNQAHTGSAELRPYHSLTDFVATIDAIVKQAGGQSFTYAYWSELDHLSHAHGSASTAVEQHLAELDAGIDSLLHGLKGTDTAVLVTADHGFVDIAADRLIDLANHPELTDTLRVPLCGEPRTAYCYVSPDRTASFLDYAGSELSKCAVCVDSAELIERGLFGPGDSHPRLADRIGDFALLMRDGYAIQDKLPGEQRPRMIGMHGGCSNAELKVPLIVAEA